MKREAVTSAQNPKIKELLSLYEKSKVRRESEQSRQMLDSGFLSEASLRSCFLDLEEGASEGSWWLEDSSAGEKDGGRLRDLRLSLEWWLLSAFDDSFS